MPEGTSQPRLSRSAESCHWCGGIGKVLPDVNFLLARLRARSDHRWIGSSSDALVVAALTGEPPSDRPFDGWDLGRCLVTLAVAPPSLAERMEPIVARWTDEMEREKAESGYPYYGVPDAVAMLQEHVGSVREAMERIAA